jgi:hypothetical protein
LYPQNPYSTISQSFEGGGIARLCKDLHS